MAITCLVGYRVSVNERKICFSEGPVDIYINYIQIPLMGKNSREKFVADGGAIRDVRVGFHPLFYFK